MRTTEFSAAVTGAQQQRPLWEYLFVFGQVRNMDLGTKLIAMDSADAKTPSKSTSRRPQSNGRRPGPGFGQKLKFDFAYPSKAGYVWLYF